MYFGALGSAQQSAERVATHVEFGGHDIPASAITRRLEITFAHALEAVVMVERFELTDNHQGQTRSMLPIENGAVTARDSSESLRINRAIAELVAAAAAHPASKT